MSTPMSMCYCWPVNAKRKWHKKNTFNPFKKKNEFRFVGMHFTIKYYIINFQLFAILR